MSKVVSIASMLGLPSRAKKVQSDSDDDSLQERRPHFAGRDSGEGAFFGTSSADREDDEKDEEQEEQEEQDSFKVMSTAHGMPVLEKPIAVAHAHASPVTLHGSGGNDSDGDEEDDDVSLSEDSVYLRMTEHDTPRVIEEIFRRMPMALDLVDTKAVSKQFFTGHARTTNEEIFFRGDITTPALRGAMSAAASKAIAKIDLRSRQAPCTTQFKLGSQVTPVETGFGLDGEDPALKLALLQRTHNTSEVEQKRAQHEHGKNQEQVLPPRPVEARDLMRSITPSTIDQLSSPRQIVQKPSSPESKSRPHSINSSRPTSAVQPKTPDSSRPSNQRKRVSKDASFSALSDAPELPVYTAPLDHQAAVKPRPKSASKALKEPEINSNTSNVCSSSSISPAPTTSRNSNFILTNIVPEGSRISSPVGYSKHSRKNTAFIISLVHGYKEVGEDSDSDDDENEWDTGDLINGNKPIDRTVERKKKHWKHRRVIMGPTVGSAEENEMRAAGTWKEFVKPKRKTMLSRSIVRGGGRGSNNRVRSDTEDDVTLETNVEETEDKNEEASPNSEEDFSEEDIDEQLEMMREHAENAAIEKRLQFRKDYLTYKRSLNDADNMKPFAWLNTATSQLDNNHVSMKLPLHALEGGRNSPPASRERDEHLKRAALQPVELQKSRVHFHTEDIQAEHYANETEPEPVYAVSHGVFTQFDTKNTRQVILDPNEALLQNDAYDDPKSIKNSVNHASVPHCGHLYDEYYDALYAEVLDKLLLHGEAHKVTHLHTHLSKLDGPHEISLKSAKTPDSVSSKSGEPQSPVSRNHLSEAPEKGSPTIVSEDTVSKSAQIDARKKLQAKIAAMEREILLPSNLNNNNKEENGPPAVLGNDALSPVSRKHVFELSKSTVAKATEQLKVLLAGAPEPIAPPPRAASLRPKPLRERNVIDPPILPAGVKAPVIQTQHKRRWNQFSFVTPEMEAMAGLNVAALMEVLLQSHNSQQTKDNTGKRHSAIGVPDAAVGKTKPNPRVLSSELMQLFTGFSKMDVNGDGLLSADDMNEFVRDHNADVHLPLHVLQEIVYAQDDAQRGALTFDAVQSYYMRLRPVLDEQLHVWEKAAAEAPILPKGKGKENAKNASVDNEVVPPENIKLPFLQLLLYRLLVFASLSGDDGQVELLTAFQQFVEQYGAEAADRAFELVFLRKTSMVKEGDQLDLAGFVSHVRAHSIESTFRPSIFEIPAVRVSKTSTEMRLKKPSQPDAMDKWKKRQGGINNKHRMVK